MTSPPAPLSRRERGSTGQAMNSRFVITDHAVDRFAERHAGVAALKPDQYRDLLLAELESGIPFGGQIGNDELCLLPSGAVAAITWKAGRGIVKTVLTREQAIANMEAQGAILRPARAARPQVRDPRAASTIDKPKVKAELRALAEQHLKDGVGRKQRNAVLRERGYDPSGEAGEIYRAAYRALVDAMWARKREE